MSNSNSPWKPPLALIAGPTASGKSALAVRIAQSVEETGRRAIIINADSAQVYEDLRVLSARPSVGEMGGIDHRLYGTWNGAVPCSAADWADAAKREIAKTHEQGGVPILVGGTGLYMRTLLEGIAPVPAIDDAIRAEVRALSQEEARKALEREDPEAAERLSGADSSRTTRALEVVRSTGRTLADWQEEKVGGIGSAITLHPLILLPERSELNVRCERRFARMIDEGAKEEVAALIERRLDPTLPVMRAIGVREIATWLDGRWTRKEVEEAGAIATRQYAKRQVTWFRHQPPDWWNRIENYSSELDNEILLRFGP